MRVNANGASGGLLDDPALLSGLGDIGDINDLSDIDIDRDLDSLNDTTDTKQGNFHLLGKSITGWVRDNKQAQPEKDLPSFLHELHFEEEIKKRTMSQAARSKLKGQADAQLRKSNKWIENRKDEQGRYG